MRFPDRRPFAFEDWTLRIPSFDDLKLEEALLHGVYSYGLSNPTAIQQLAIQPILGARNIVVESPCQSGKTCAYTIGILGKVNPNEKKTQALVLAPSPDLAFYIHSLFHQIGKYIQNLTVALFHDKEHEEDYRTYAADQPHIIITTPFLAHSLISGGFLKCENISFACLDEADELLSKFREETLPICQSLPQTVHYLLFSETISNPILGFSSKFMTDPVKISLREEKIHHFIVDADETNLKWSILENLFHRIDLGNSIIFTKSQETALFLADCMEREHFSFSCLVDSLPQSSRDEAIHEYRLGASRALITTDSLHRGVSLQASVVFNYDFPNSPKDYLNRVLRTSKQEKKVVINICDPDDKARLPEIQRKTSCYFEPLPDNLSKFFA